MGFLHSVARAVVCALLLATNSCEGAKHEAIDATNPSEPDPSASDSTDDALDEAGVKDADGSVPSAGEDAGTGGVGDASEDSGSSSTGNAEDDGSPVVEGVDSEHTSCLLDSNCTMVEDRVEPLPPPSCPTSPPTLAGSCDPTVNDKCSYGHLAAVCRDIYECVDGSWQSTWEARNCEVEVCPADPPHGEPCTIGEEVGREVPCAYEGGVSCYCDVAFGFPGETGSWLCFTPPPSADCPLELPNLGDGCETHGVSCRYGYSSAGCYSGPYSTVFCYQGRWEVGLDVSCGE